MKTIRYYKAPLRRTEYTAEPDLPEGTLLNWVLRARDFAILETFDWLPPKNGVLEIGGDLEALLASSATYPPARALASRDLEDSPLAWAEFAQQLERSLAGSFTGQVISGFVLVRCLKDQGDKLERWGHGGLGHFYWALAASDGQIAWTSDVDYEVHWSRIEDFALPENCNLPSELPGSLVPTARTFSRLREAAIYSKASILCGEYAWPANIFPAILREAEANAMACLGGTFQFRTETSTAEMYWATTQTTPRLDEESWLDFCSRARQETMLQFESIMDTTDFEAEAKSFKVLEDELKALNLKATDCLVFFATFENK